VRELFDALTKRGVDVKIWNTSGGRTHARPHERVARRSGYSYDKLLDMDESTAILSRPTWR